jgi:hypothetical protein
MALVRIATKQKPEGVLFKWTNPRSPLPQGVVLTVETDDGRVVWDSKAKNCYPPTHLLSELAIIWSLR